MLRTASLLVIVFFSAGFLMAQVPTVSVFGGFAVARIDDNQGPTGTHITNLGWDITMHGNFNRNFAIVGDLGNYYGTHNVPPATGPGALQAHTTFFTFMGGPQFSFPWKDLTPFARAMIGVIREYGHLVPQGSKNTTLSGLGEALGGGLGCHPEPTHRLAFSG
jgi:hypothetical protein